MIDSLIRLLPDAKPASMNNFPERYALLTLHRPSNVDDNASLQNILDAILEVRGQLTVIFPVHPRTRQRIEQFGIRVDKLQFMEPVPYIEFLSLMRHATVVITDSGGIQGRGDDLSRSTVLNIA